MGVTIFIGFIILNLVGFIKENKALQFISFLILTLLFTFNTWNGDYDNYKYHFEEEYLVTHQLRKKVELGFEIIYKVSSAVSSNYQVMVIIIGLLGFSIFLYSIRMFNSNRHVIFLTYFLYPFFIEVVQIRTFVGGMIMCFTSLVYLKKNNKLYLLAGNLLSCSFHMSYIVFLPLFLMVGRCNFKSKRIKYAELFIPALSIVLSVFLLQNIDILSGLINTFSKSSRFAYISTESRPYWFVYVGIFIIQFLHIILVKICDSNLDSMHDIEINVLKFTYKLNLYAVLFMPLIIISTQFERLTREILLFNYIVYALYIKNERNRDNKYPFILLMLFTVFCQFIFQMIMSRDNFNTAFMAVLNHNLLLEKLR